MGRAKLNMELIKKEKSRNLTYKKRKEGLMRKMHEFTTLCDVNACMIIYGPKVERGAVEPEIWPQNIDQVRRIIDIYKAKNKDSGHKTFGLSDFFHERKRKIEEELAKLRKKNMEAKYPTWLDLFNLITESRLRDFVATLSNKADYVKSRIEFLRRNKECLDMNLMDYGRFYSPSASTASLRGTEYEVMNQQMQYPAIEEMQQNSMMMLLMNENDQCLQFGGASTGANIQVFYEAAPRPLASYMMMPPQPQLPFPVLDAGTQEDIVQYQMNHRARYFD